MKTINIVIPHTVASITALIESLNDELLNIELPADDDVNTDDVAAAVDTLTTEPGDGVTHKPEDYPIMVNGVEVDSEGLPYHADIHGAGANRIQKKNGKWKYKRGLDEATKLRVETELRGAMGTTSNVVDINTAAPAPAPVVDAAPAPAPAAAPAPAPVVVVETTPTYTLPNGGGDWTREQLLAAGHTDASIDLLPVVVVAPVETVAEITFPVLMSLITPALAANDITNDQILAALNQVGTANGCVLTALPLLSARPDLIGQVKTALFG